MMNVAHIEQTYLSVDTLIDRNIKNQSVSDIDFNVSTNCGNISTKGISSAGVTVTDESLLKGTFCSETVFNLSHEAFTETKIKVLEGGLDFDPTQKCIRSLNCVRTLSSSIEKCELNGIFVMKLRKTLVQPQCSDLNLTGHPL